MRQNYQDDLLDRHLRTYLGDIEPQSMTLLREQLEWVEIAGGQVLMTQGEPGDAMYLVLSGRLRAYLNESDGTRRAAREMGRGQIIGEMSLITGEPRSATVIAIRDAVLVRLAKSAFNALFATSPQLSIVLTRQIIEHLRAGSARHTLARPVTIGLVPISAGLSPRAFADHLALHFAKIGPTCVIDGADVGRDLQDPGIARRDGLDLEANRRITLRLNEMEAAHDFVLLVGDDGPTPWTHRCCRGSDEILLLANAKEPAQLHDSEKECLMSRPGRGEAAEVLVLLHPADLPCPRDTHQWLARRAVDDHVHIRPELPADMARLARIQSHTAVGLVLAGGGARGLAHLGIYQALRERGIEIDVVGGTSIGAVMATLVASDRPVAEVLQMARRSFSVNPTNDFNFVPLLSLIKGRRMRTIVERGVVELLGFPAAIEDLWKNYYCVASNYSQSSEQVLRSGDLTKAMRASMAIPGALPPVLRDGDLLCDGGTFNNFPVDVMRRMRGVGTVIGVDLNARKPRPIDLEEIPGTWALLRDRLRPYRKRRYRFPSLVAYLMNVQILYSMSRQQHAKALTDLYFNPPLERVGMLQWEKFDDIVQQGYAHGVAVLDASAPGELHDSSRSGALARDAIDSKAEAVNG
jgi:NTE family protein